MEPSLTMFWLEFLTGRFFFLIAGAVGLVAFLGTMYFMNRSIGVKFGDEIVPLLKRNPQAASLYFGARLIAVAIFLGMLVLGGASVSVTYN